MMIDFANERLISRDIKNGGGYIGSRIKGKCDQSA